MKMKKMIFLMLTLLIWGAASMNAQVNIGSTDAPHKGAILDLSKSNSESGVLLPRVYLFNVKQFQLPADEGMDPTGMLVYNTNSSLSDGVGLYAWNGSEWRSMIGDSRCVPVKATSNFSKTGSDTKITVTVTEGTPNFSYTWYKGETLVKTTANVSAASDAYITDGAGSYTVRIANPCTVTPVALTFTVDASGETLTDNGNGTFTDGEGNLVYNGKTYTPVESDIPGVYLDEGGDIAYTGADGIPGTPDDDTYVIPENPLPRQNIRVAFVSPLSPFPSGGTVTDPIVLDFSTPYSGKVKYVSADPDIISVSADGKLTANSGNITAQTTILAILEDGSIATTDYRILNTAMQGDANFHLSSVQNSIAIAPMNDVYEMTTDLLATNGSNNVFNKKSFSYEILDAGGTGSTLSPYGRWLHVGSTPGTVTIKTTATNTNNQEFTGTITITVLGEPSAETVYETTSTNWMTLEAAPEYAGGSGTEASPYQISSVRQLKKLALDIEYNGGVAATYGKFFELTTDLDFAGDNVIRSLIGTFRGTFDGKGHIIKNLTINSTFNVAIFDGLAFGELKNLGRVGGATITTGSNGAGLVLLLNRGKLSNCFNTADVTAGSIAGGLVAGTATTSIATATSIIENCYNTGNVTANNDKAGGLIGDALYNGGTLIIKNSYNSGKVQAVNVAGGLSANISPDGGIGQTYEYSNVFNFGDVIATANSDRVGSILGGTSIDDPSTTPLTIIANNTVSRPDVTKKNTSVAVNGRLIGYNTSARQTFAQSVINMNPTLKEDAKYTLNYSKTTAFVSELGSAFKYANGRTPKLAWEK
ncbi:hypothetical protein FACS189421_01700 [Bacteroidia bacterium]|nr:hypothetical protein FACS189421_01700 [Bacteroidia bacterium]GHT48267.1 hypothetical protein FACS189440_11420 [Bacteroidia bacterium]